MLPAPTLLDVEAAAWLLRDSDGNLRAALVCWGIVLSALVILRIPREVLLGCLIVAGATVGLAATVVDVTPERTTAGPPQTRVAALPQGPAADPPERERPY